MMNANRPIPRHWILGTREDKIGHLKITGECGLK